MRLSGRVLATGAVAAVLAATALWPRAAARLVTLVDQLPSAASATTPPAGDAGMDIVFAAQSRDASGNATGPQRIYTVKSDGTGLHQVSPADGRWYDWPSYAMNGTEVVYTAGDAVSASNPNPGQDIYLMKRDGTGTPVRVTTNAWRDGQPKVSPDGRRIVFSSFWNEFPDSALYSLDLPSLQVSNLSQLNNDRGSLDGDPRFAYDGTKLVIASSLTPGGTGPTQIFEMNADGSGRRQITHDGYFNTDPALSPDGRTIVYSSYRGSNQPVQGQENNGFTFPTADWHIVLVDVQTGSETVVTKGTDCAVVAPPQTCAVGDSSGWVPQWSPDGSEIAFMSVLNAKTSGLYAVHPDGTGAHALFASSSFGFAYWDWARAGTAPAGAMAAIGTKVPTSRLLFGGPVYRTGSEPQPTLYASGPDRWDPTWIVPGTPLNPTFARWSADRKRIVFTARVGFDQNAFNPAPAPPAGAVRHVHFTLRQLNPLFVPPQQPTDIAQEQVFVMNADGSDVRQLTTPWTEDYMDALADGDARGNTEPDFSADGRYILFTNTSSLDSESFLLRLDLQTGAVMNLTNSTSGAVPVADSEPRWSPDGSRIAFVSTVNGNGQLFLMNADGTGVSQVTDDDYYDSSPAWSPDGKTIAYVSYRGPGLPFVETDDLNGEVLSRQIQTSGWQLVRLDVASRAQTVMTPADGVVFRPVFSPDGSRIAFISAGGSRQPDIYVISAAGGPASPVQTTARTKEEFVDWR